MNLKRVIFRASFSLSTFVRHCNTRFQRKCCLLFVFIVKQKIKSDTLKHYSKCVSVCVRSESEIDQKSFGPFSFQPVGDGERGGNMNCLMFPRSSPPPLDNSDFGTILNRINNQTHTPTVILFFNSKPIWGRGFCPGLDII